MTSDDLTPPEVLLGIPAPPAPAGYFDTGKLTLTLTQAERLRDAYFDDVAAYLESNAIHTERELIPAVEWGLRLYNAENFTGELSPAERERLHAVYERFGAAALLPSPPPPPPPPRALPPSTDGGGNGDRDEKTDEGLRGRYAEPPLHETFLQRLLASDGEMPMPCTRMSGLLLCILAIVGSNAGAGAAPRFPYTSLWRLRAHFRHQLCLQRRAHRVFLELSACVDAILGQPAAAITVGALLEVGHVQGYYHRRELARQTFERAARLSGLIIGEAAILGVRTRWQRHQLVQAVLDARSARGVPADSTADEQPRTVGSEADGHDLLDRPRALPEAAPLPVPGLHPEDKAILLALAGDGGGGAAGGGLARHRTQPLLERLVVDPAPSPFVVRCQTLLLRARLEGGRDRVRERAFTQLAALIEQTAASPGPPSPSPSPSYSAFARTRGAYFYTVAYPSIWALRAEYAELCVGENLYKTALDLYERLLDWQGMITCCRKLDKRRRVESLARALLETDPGNPALWVALGEATREEGPLWKAWELGGGRSAAPMRALARLALERGNYADVVRFFDEALRINPVFGGDWFALGYAALKLRLWGRGGEAFTRVCQIDPDDAFAWNNLASIMLRENKPRPAFNAMSQALRNNRRDWRMWMNYFHIGIELKEVLEATNTLNIILDIGKRGVRLEREAMGRFVDHTLAYLRGEIRGSSAEAAADVRFEAPGMAAGFAAGEADIPHAPARGPNEDESAHEDEEAVGLAPLGLDDEAEVGEWGGGAAAARAAANTAAEAAVRKRHEARVRDLFARLLETFVSDPDLYACAARLFRALDGAAAAYFYRVKELRACRQKEQWERDDALFARVVECLEAMADDAIASAAASPNPEPAESPPKPPTNPLEETLQNLRTTLSASEEYMESTEGFARLRALAARVRAALQQGVRPPDL